MMKNRLTSGAVALILLLVAGAAQAVPISSVGSGFWTNPGSWSPAQVPAGTDDVIIASGSTNTIATNVAITVASLTIQTNGVLTHLANSTDVLGERYKVVLNVAGNLTIDAGGQINADLKGYASANGPGKSAMGAGHGGAGSLSGPFPYLGGTTYGLITAPTNLGSGGGGFAGGGAILLTVAGTATINGLVSATGGGSVGIYYSASGGSVFLTTGALTGNGTIRANGGSYATQCTGGGGRVAVILTNSADFGAVKMQAYAGAKGTEGNPGAGGTVYLQTTNHASGRGKLVVDYNNILPTHTAEGVYTLQNGVNTSSYEFSEIVLTNGGVYGLDTNDTLVITNTTISGDPTNVYDGIYIKGGTLTIPAAFTLTNFFIGISATNSTFDPTSSLTVGSNATLRIDVPWTMNYPLTIAPGGTMDHSANLISETYKINLTINANLDVQAGGQINVDARGYTGTAGPGGSSGGAGYGGASSITAPPWLGGTTYGSITAPTNLGSAGSGLAGGGAILLTVAGTATVNGLVSATGAGGGGYCGGSGGSVFLTTGVLTGNGTIRANGGGPATQCSGGGGRVAVILTNSADFGAVTMQAYAGAKGSENNPGAAGTIYLKTSAQGLGQGTLLINASNIVVSHSEVTTLINSKVSDTMVGTVIITNQAILAIDTNQSLTVNGSWLRGTNTSFIASSNSTVSFTGTNTATITGANTFYNLTAGAAGKTILFENGKTNTVNGILTLANVTLDSASGSTSWCLNASANMHSVSNVTVGRSDARPGATIEAYDSTDQGGNSNWVFATSGPATNIWTGATGSDWFKTNNWSLGRTTVYTDSVLIPGSCTNYPVLNFHKRLLSLTIASNATMSLNGYDLTVDQTISVTGTLTAVGAATVTIGGNLDFTGGGVFNAASSTVRIVGSNAQTVVSAGNAFYQLTISNSAAPVVFADAVVASNIVNQATPVTFAGSVTVASAFRTQGTNVTLGGAVTATTFQNANGPLVFSGALTAQDFNNANGALVFSGAVATVTFTNWQGDLTFRDNVSTRDFYCAPGAMALMFNAGKTYTVGNLDLYGRVGYPIQLRSSAGSHWCLNVTNRATVRLVDVQYSDASGGQTIRALAATDSGGNTNWVFDGPWQTWAGTNSAIFTNANNWVPAGAPDATARVLIDGYYSNAPVLSGTATVAQLMVGGGVTTATLTVNGQLTTMGDVEVLPKGTITHAANTSSEANKLNLTVGSNLTVYGAINVDGMGYSANNGPGKGLGGGAGYGGVSSITVPPWLSGMTYGSITAPTNLGSSGNGLAGGGAILLTVAGTATVNGLVSATGAGGGGYCGGSGGSVFLITGVLTGNGTIRANGGGPATQCSGGGGRVAVILTNSTNFGVVKIQAYAGAKGSENNPGAAGTVYLQTSAQVPGQGTLLIDANNIDVSHSIVTTLISSNVTDTVVGTVIITNQAILAIDTNQSLTVNGSWMNNNGTNMSFVACSNSTVTLAGINTTTVLGSNTFFNLICTNAGKTVYFQAGRTNTVNGMLKLGSTVPGSTVTLRSTAEEDWWYLTLATGVGTQQIARVAVRDSNAGGGQTIYAGNHSVNQGHNVNWVFPPGGTVFVIR